MKRTIAALALVAGIAISGCASNGWSEKDLRDIRAAVNRNPNTTASQDECIVRYITDHLKRSDVDDSNSDAQIKGQLVEAFIACENA